MKPGWSATLERRVRRADPTAYLHVEAQALIRSHVRHTKDDWSEADSLTGLFRRDDGALILADGGPVALISNATSDGYYNDFHVSPIIVAQVDWALGESMLRVDSVTAYLHPQVNGGNPKTVHLWRCTPMQVARIIPFAEAGTPDDVWEIYPARAPIDVLVAGATTPQDWTFVFPGGFLAGAIPEGGLTPMTVLKIEALRSDGSPADNVGWGRDSAQSSVSSGGRTLWSRRLTPISWNQFLKDSTPPGGTVRCNFRRGSFTAATVTFTTNDFDLGATPTDDVSFVGRGEVPLGTSILYEVKDDGAVWRAFTDGQLSTELTNVSKRQTYEMRATLTPNSGGDQTPALWELGVREIKRFDLSDIATVGDVRWAVDPIELRGEVSEVRITCLRDGVPHTAEGHLDGSDFISELLAGNHIGSLLLRLYIADPALAKGSWLHLDDFLIDDYESEGGAVVLIGLSPLALLRGVLPVFDSVAGERIPYAYNNFTLKAVYDDLLDNQLVLPGRHRGPGVENTAVTVTKRIVDTEAKTELDAIAYLADGAVISRQGLVTFVSMAGLGPIRATLPQEEITYRVISPGFRSRIPEFFVPWDYDDDERRFRQQIRRAHGPAITKLGVARIDPPTILEDVIAAYIRTQANAEAIAQRVTDRFATGLLLWEIESTIAHPELDPGDLVVVQTDRFVARDPSTDTGIAGMQWALAVVASVNDPWGRSLTVWIQSYANIISSGDVVDVVTTGAPNAIFVLIDQYEEPSLPGQVEIRLRSFPPGATIRRLYHTFGATIPAKGDSAWTVYTAPFFVARNETDTMVLSAYAEIAPFTGPIFSQSVAPDVTPQIVTMTLVQDTGSPPTAMTVTVVPDGDVASVRYYRKSGGWPTTNGNSDGPLDDAQFTKEASVFTDGGGVYADGTPAAGGLTEHGETTRGGAAPTYANTTVVYVIAVPLDKNRVPGPRKTANVTITGTTPPALTAFSAVMDQAGTSCGARRRYDIAWTPNASVADGTHDLDVYVRVAGTRYFVFTETSPASVTSKADQFAPCYADAGGNPVLVRWEYELYETGPVIKDSGVTSYDPFEGFTCQAPE